MDNVLENALSIIRKEFNKVPIDSIKILASGFGSIVIEGNQGIIFRIARNVDIAKKYVMECKVLPQIEKYLNVNIPKPIWYKFNRALPPYGIMAYRKLEGNPIAFSKVNQRNRDILAKEVANFIASLHKIPYYKHNFRIIPKIENDKRVLRVLRNATSEFLKSNLTDNEYKKMETWWEKILSDETFYHHRLALCHGDIWYENILVDESYTRIVGVVDFSDMKIADPAVDLAPQIYLGREFHNAVLHEYINVFGHDKSIKHRIKRHRELREVYGLYYVIKHNQVEEYEDTISKIRNNIILNN
ncbi:MAG: phosphotransferase [Caldicoprobacterales bacterium]|nr:phosphotransferase [Clostridiales bacterium]